MSSELIIGFSTFLLCCPNVTMETGEPLFLFFGPWKRRGTSLPVMEVLLEVSRGGERVRESVIAPLLSLYKGERRNSFSKPLTCS